MSKLHLLIIALGVVILAAYFTILTNANPSKISKSEEDAAVNQARYLYQVDKEQGRDFTFGPCLSNALMPGWVADIAHNPREPIDDLPENQCPAFREGRASHFVELDVEGNLIRAR